MNPGRKDAIDDVIDRAIEDFSRREKMEELEILMRSLIDSTCFDPYLPEVFLEYPEEIPPRELLISPRDLEELESQLQEENLHFRYQELRWAAGELYNTLSVLSHPEPRFFSYLLMEDAKEGTKSMLAGTGIVSTTWFMQMMEGGSTNSPEVFLYGGIAATAAASQAFLSRFLNTSKRWITSIRDFSKSLQRFEIQEENFHRSLKGFLNATSALPGNFALAPFKYAPDLCQEYDSRQAYNELIETREYCKRGLSLNVDLDIPQFDIGRERIEFRKNNPLPLL